LFRAILFYLIIDIAGKPYPPGRNGNDVADKACRWKVVSSAASIIEPAGPGRAGRTDAGAGSKPSW
jgi:hypothetical protein